MAGEKAPIVLVRQDLTGEKSCVAVTPHQGHYFEEPDPSNPNLLLINPTLCDLPENRRIDPSQPSLEREEVLSGMRNWYEVFCSFPKEIIDQQLEGIQKSWDEKPESRFRRTTTD